MKLKESGIEWLGQIPEHWKIEKCKNFFVIQNAIVGDLWSKTRLLSLTLGGIVERDINNPEGKFPSDFSTYQIVKKNDLVFCLFDVEETPRTIGLSSMNGMITGAYTVIRTQTQNERFVTYFFINLDNYKNLRFLYKGLRKTIAKEDLLNLKIPLPPLEEQRAIADFLDGKCNQIEDFITKKEKLITLLEEKKQALINQAVTKGLDQTQKLKNSGIEWLGQIPEHWGVKKMKHLGTLQNGINVGSDAFGSGFPFVSYGNVYKNSSLPKIVEGLINSSKSDQKIYSVKKGDVFFTRTSETIEEIGISSVCLHTIENAVFAGFLIRFRPIRKILDENFSKFYFRSNIHRIFFIKENGLVTRASLSQELLKNLPVLLPPLEEQKTIAQYLDTQIEKIDLAISKIRSQIKLIKEYKTTLISESVCGRIGVR